MSNEQPEDDVVVATVVTSEVSAGDAPRKVRLLCVILVGPFCDDVLFDRRLLGMINVKRTV